MGNESSAGEGHSWRAKNGGGSKMPLRDDATILGWHPLHDVVEGLEERSDHLRPCAEIRKGGEERIDAGERTTGTRDEYYSLISVLYRALHGAENCNTYALDAEAAGDQRLASFFREAGVIQAQVAERAKGGLLGIGSTRPGAASGAPTGTIAPGEMHPTTEAPRIPRRGIFDQSSSRE